MDEFTEQEISAALTAVDAAKRRHNDPTGRGELTELGLRPASFIAYAAQHANANRARIAQENSQGTVFAAGWLDGVEVGVAIALARHAPDQLASISDRPHRPRSP